MKNIIFLTGNKRKIREARSSCDLFDINIEPKSVFINEIQDHDPINITKQKARDAFKAIKKPLIVNDAFWSITALNGFPGGYMKDVSEWLESQDFINLMKDKKDKSIIITDCTVYIDKNGMKVFSKEIPCEFVMEPKGMGNSIEQVVVLNGKTLAEHHDDGDLAEKPDELIYYEFAKWYSKL
jgi:non-canonical purine NTP pyrophosphatase (RdgB/HAM1 family)